MDRYPPDGIALLFFGTQPVRSQTGTPLYLRMGLTIARGKTDAGIYCSNRRTKTGTGFIADLASSPGGGSGGAVFEDDAGRKQFVPDAIGLGEILRLASDFALFD